MDKIPLSEYEVAPLDDVADGLIGCRIVFVNVFAVSTSAGWTLIDAGLPFLVRPHPIVGGEPLWTGRKTPGDRSHAWTLRSYGRD
jgi:hypothetical protein